MLKWFSHIIFIFILTFKLFGQRFGEFASAVFIRNCGSNVFYNTTGSGVNCINTDCSVTFQSRNFGTFNQNSDGLLFLGGEIKTWRNNDGNSCGGFINYTVYPTGSRPASPTFTQVSLDFFSNCCSTTFCTGGGPCGGNDQKWQKANHNFDLTDRAVGNYTLEVYYEYSGNDGGTTGCPNVKYINNGGSATNYTATFSVVTPGSGACTILPIELLSFSGECKDTDIELNWSTLVEVDNDYFVIEKSKNGDNWEKVDRIEGDYNSTSIKNYHINFQNDFDYKYFKLSQVDNNGKKNEVSIIYLDCENQNKFYTFPNPSNNAFNIHISDKFIGESVLRIFDSKGRLVYLEDLILTKTTEIIKIVQKFAAGLYFIVLQNANETQLLKHTVLNLN